MLRDILENCYGLNAVIYILPGKLMSRAIRTHCLVDTLEHTFDGTAASEEMFQLKKNMITV